MTSWAIAILIAGLIAWNIYHEIKFADYHILASQADHYKGLSDAYVQMYKRDTNEMIADQHLLSRRLEKAEEQLYTVTASYEAPYVYKGALITAYSPSDDVSGLNADSTPLTTSTGVQPQWGYVAVNPAIIPYGTLMYIPGYGTALAVDTGYAVQTYNGIQVDVYMDTHEQAMQWGKQHRDIIILTRFEKELWDGVRFERETQTIK